MKIGEALLGFASFCLDSFTSGRIQGLPEDYSPR